MKKLPRLISPAIQGGGPNSKPSQLNFPARENPPLNSRLETHTPLTRQISPRIQGVKPIPTFGGTFFALPRKRRRYNDDVYMDPYKPDVLHFAGGQRKGIHEPPDKCVDYECHVREALKERFPLSHATPLPAETRDTAAFIRDTSHGSIIKLRGSQLTALDDLAHGFNLVQSKWGACIPDEIAPASGKFQTFAMKQLANHPGMGGSARLGQFACKFPTTGQLSRKHLFQLILPSKSV